MKVAEDNLVGEQGDPLEGFGAVGRAATNELVLAVEMFDKPGGAKLLDDAAGVARSD